MWAPKLRTPSMLLQLLAALGGDPDHLGVRRPRGPEPVHQEVPLLEVRQQGLAEGGDGRRPGDHDDGETGEEQPGPVHETGQGSGVATLEQPDERRLPRPEGRAPQQQQRQGGGHGERHHHRHQDRQRVRQGEWLEEGTGQAVEEQHRHDGDDVDQGGVGDRAPHLHGGLEDDARTGAYAGGAVLPESTHDVLDVDDGVVDHHADRDDQAGEDHRVDGRAPPVEHEQARPAATAGWRSR